jgi:hypothetical protein
LAPVTSGNEDGGEPEVLVCAPAKAVDHSRILEK